MSLVIYCRGMDSRVWSKCLEVFIGWTHMLATEITVCPISLTNMYLHLWCSRILARNVLRVEAVSLVDQFVKLEGNWKVFRSPCISAYPEQLVWLNYYLQLPQNPVYFIQFKQKARDPHRKPSCSAALTMEMIHIQNALQSTKPNLSCEQQRSPRGADG